jgi:hypothetical protein
LLHQRIQHANVFHSFAVEDRCVLVMLTDHCFSSA